MAYSCFVFLRSTFQTFPKPPFPMQNWYWNWDLLIANKEVKQLVQLILLESILTYIFVSNGPNYQTNCYNLPILFNYSKKPMIGIIFLLDFKSYRWLTSEIFGVEVCFKMAISHCYWQFIFKLRLLLYNSDSYIQILIIICKCIASFDI